MVINTVECVYRYYISPIYGPDRVIQPLSPCTAISEIDELSENTRYGLLKWFIHNFIV